MSVKQIVLFHRVAFVFALGCLLVACDHSSLESQLIGQWKGELNLSKEASANPAVQAAQDNFQPTLNLKEDKTFEMTVAVLPIQGRWKLNDGTVTLEITKVAGQSKENFKKDAQRQMASNPFIPQFDLSKADQPLSFNVSKDARTLSTGDLAKTFSFLGPMAPSGAIVFKRLGAPEP